MGAHSKTISRGTLGPCFPPCQSWDPPRWSYWGQTPKPCVCVTFTLLSCIWTQCLLQTLVSWAGIAAVSGPLTQILIRGTLWFIPLQPRIALNCVWGQGFVTCPHTAAPNSASALLQELNLVVGSGVGWFLLWLERDWTHHSMSQPLKGSQTAQFEWWIISFLEKRVMT